MELYRDVATQYRDFATYAHDDSPCFEEWALGVAEDPEVQAWVASLPQVKQQPNLVFAAARWHGVPAPGPYDALRTALLADDGTVRTTIMRRSTQTNEVGRLATLTPALTRLQEQAGRPLALIEAGASAGLCLYPDRFAYEWRTEQGVVRAAPMAGPMAGSVAGSVAVPGSGPLSETRAATLACDVTGEAPLRQRLPEIAWRGGIDLNPLDVDDADAMGWLANLVWPEHEDRRQRLRAAVTVARAEPPTLTRGDLLTELPGLVEEAAPHGQVVVFHSAVIAYLAEADRARFHRTATDLVADGACHWLSNEAPRVLPEVTATAPPVPAGLSPFVMGVDGRAVAWTHPHGRWLRWL